MCLISKLFSKVAQVQTTMVKEISKHELVRERAETGIELATN